MEHHFRRLLDPERKKFEDPEKFIPSLLKGDEVVADMGCGPGYYCPVLEEHSRMLYCVDLSEKAIEMTRSRVKRDSTTLLNESSDHTSIPSSSIDVVIFSNSFHDMNPSTVYKEVLRILKPSGKVIIVDWKKDAPIGPPVDVRMSKEDYIRVFKDFDLESEFTPGPYHFGLVFKRKLQS
ncbi:class I SAM-dependent methyltransferase [Metallosphaera hakonensis]|uniref:Methyltransferase domain-containing protein n=1 Tax=Metallosphaera hakonensis JCM 8857 = DSM 7519 TaxID=1293036 RepID=A0A2U9IVV6_9CREN|nr:class I SAM-dependent methyltransferase [Metallosphaera hakonensis]AWS00211.1 methyltransferase domain-containing protein [Metallosphaera hakonensis JCM 8857 = DSM 7519]